MDRLADGVVRILTATPADIGASDFQNFEAALDDTERRRARRFRFDQDRRAYVVVHALRRRAVADALGCDLAFVRFEETADGEPRLAPPPDSPLHFSHTRTRTAVAVALTRIGSIGIDVEPLRPDAADMALLRPYVADAAMDGGAQGFFRQWTALEAYWKAVGSGLNPNNPRIRLRHRGADCIEVTHEGERPAGVRGHVFHSNALAPASMAVALLAATVPACEWEVRHCNSSIHLDGSSG